MVTIYYGNGISLYFVAFIRFLGIMISDKNEKE